LAKFIDSSGQLCLLWVVGLAIFVLAIF